MYARSVAGGLYYLGDRGKPTDINKPLDILCQIIDDSTLCIRSWIRCTLPERTPLYLSTQCTWSSRIPSTLYCYPIDNKCALRIATDTAQAKRSEAIDMRLHWMRDRVRQDLFYVYWREGAYYLADFYSKALPCSSHDYAIQGIFIWLNIHISNDKHTQS